MRNTTLILVGAGLVAVGALVAVSASFAGSDGKVAAPAGCSVAGKCTKPNCRACAAAKMQGHAAQLDHAVKAIDAAAKAVEAGDKKTALTELTRARALVAAAQSALTKRVRPAIANVRCPIMGSKLSPDKVPAGLTRTFQGRTIGFCCAGCPGAWDKLTGAQKQAKLNKVLPAKAAPPDLKPAGKFVNVRCPIMGSKLSPDKALAGLTRTFQGKKVGFCCAGCPGAWDKLTDADKQAKLDKVLPRTN